MWMGRGGCEGVRGGLCFMCGTIMQINDLLQCRAEQHNACTPVHHSTSPVPPLQAGWKKKEKNHFSSQSRGWKQGRGVTEVCLEAQTFSFPCQQDHVIRTAAAELGGGRLMLLGVTSIALAYYLNQSLISPRKTGEEKREIDNIFCIIMHRQFVEI